VPEDFLISALAGLSILGAMSLLAIWIAAIRFEARYPVEYRAAGIDAVNDTQEVLAVAGRGITLRDLVALGLVMPSTGKAPTKKKKPGSAEEPPRSGEQG
jgi:hypothetical protein